MVSNYDLINSFWLYTMWELAHLFLLLHLGQQLVLMMILNT